jgi:hypothetical protein
VIATVVLGGWLLLSLVTTALCTAVVRGGHDEDVARDQAERRERLHVVRS